MKKSKVVALFFYLIFAISVICVSCTGSVTPVQTEPEQPVEVTYTVTYKTDHGTLPDMLKNGLKVKENTILGETQLPVLTDNNAVFNGWYDSGTKAVAGEYKVLKNVTLTALWSDKATVTYSSLFGNVPASFKVELNQKLTEEKLVELECSPYTFEGWFYSKDKNGNGSGVKAKVDDLIKSDITLYAKWKTVTITFESQFGQVSPITKYTGEKITAAEVTSLSEAGYTFEGWYEGNTKLEPGEHGYPVTEDKAFIAKWTPKQYKVTFDKNANDATGTMTELILTFTTSAALSSNSFARTGYTFQGWATSSDATTAAYTDGQNFNVPAHDTILYAVWKANQYTIAFNANNSTGVTATQKVTFRQTEKLNTNTFAYHGYRFAGWNTAENGTGTSYSDKADFVVVQASDITLYAQWVEADRYIISYQNARGAANSSPTSYRASEGATLSDLSMTGYIFDGWYASQDADGNGSGTKVTSWGADAETGDITLYAKWSPRTDTAYKVEHYQENAADDGYRLFATDSTQTGTTDSLTMARANTYENFTAQAFEQKQIAPNGSTVVKIYYKRNIVTMTFNLNGGKISGVSTVSLTGKYGSTLNVGTPLKTGWTFDSWSPTLPATMENGTFTATYTANTDTAYKVVHYQQNADDDGYTLKDTDNKTGTTEGQTAATANIYDHFTADTFTQDTIAADGTTEVRINYSRETITLTLDLAGGTLDGETDTVEKSGRWGQTVIVGVPEREGYVFEGWNTVGGSLPTTYDSDAAYTAQWTAVKGITIIVNVADIDVTKSTSGSTITFTAEECESYSWLLDDEDIGTNKTCTIDTSTLTKGTYTLALEAQKGGRWYSYYAQIKVGE